MKKIFLFALLFFIANISCFSQSKITVITAKAFFNLEKKFSDNIVGKESSDLPPYLINQTLITVEIYKVPEFGGPERTLKFTAFIDDKIIFTQVQKIAFGGFTYQSLYLLNQDPTGVIVKAELYEAGKLISTLTQKLVVWSGD